jgi:branched-chain amino acid transport system substrate-binding protein
MKRINRGPAHRMVALAAASMAGILTVTACGADEGSGGTDKYFTLAVVNSLSGGYEFLGVASNAGIEAAVVELNKHGGIDGREVRIEKCDDQTNPLTARQCVEKLVGGGKADAVVGLPLSAAAEAVAPLIAQYKVPAWVLAGSYGGRDLDGQEYMFAGLPVTDDVLDAAFAWGAKKSYKDAWIVATEDETGKPCREFADAGEDVRHGLNVVGVSTMKADATTAAPQMAQIDRDADFVFLCASGAAGVVAAASYEQAGLTMPAFSIHSQGAAVIAKALAGKISNDRLYVGGFCVLGATTGLGDEYPCVERAKSFAATLRSVAPDAAPDFTAGIGYDGVMLIAQAYEAANGDRDKIPAAFEGLQDVDGALGRYSFGPGLHRGLSAQQFLVGVLKGDQWVLADPLNLPTE